MEFIYVFTKNPSLQKMVKIDICNDYEAELLKLNDQLKNVGDTTTSFSVAALFKVPDHVLDSSKLFHVLQNLLPASAYQNFPKSYYGLSIDEACKLLESLCEFSGFSNIDSQFTRFDIEQNVSNPELPSINKTSQIVKKTDTKIDKQDAISLFKKSGISLKLDNVSFKTKDHKRNEYRVTFDYKLLRKNWYVILNDYRRKKLYLFLIPSMTLINEDFKLSAVHSSSTIYEISISSSGGSFVEKHTHICFDPFKISELKYESNDSISSSSKKAKKTSTSKNSVTHCELASLKDATGHELVSFYYKGQKFIVSSWRIMLDRVIEIAYAHDSEHLLELAENGLSPFQDGNKAWMTTKESIKKDYIDCHELYTTGIYYDVNLSRKYLCDFIKLIIRKCDLDINEFSVDYI